MLSNEEIRRLIKKKEIVVPNKACMQDAETWEYEEHEVSPQIVGLVYAFMKDKYSEGETLDDMERVIGIAKERISWALRALEEHGYLTISRVKKPFLYRVAK